MNLVVTGGAGFIGSTLVRRLVDGGHHVRVFDSFHEAQDPHARWTNLRELVANGRIELVVGDVRDREMLDKALVTGSQPVDAVFHLASASTAASSCGQPVECQSVSVIGTTTLFEAVRSVGVSHVILASSSSVYGETAEELEEDVAPGPLVSPYGVAKRAAELVGAWYATTHDVRVTAFRIFSTYGVRQPDTMAVASFLSRIAAGEPVTIHGDGQAVRDLIHVDDVAVGLSSALQRTEAGYRVYNLGRGEAVTIRDLVDRLGELLGREPNLRFEEPRPGDLSRSVAVVERARTELGFAAAIGWREGLARLTAGD